MKMKEEQKSVEGTDCELQAGSCDNSHAERLVPLPAIAERLGVSKRTMHRLVGSGLFPAPVKIGKSSRWFSSDVEQYLAQLKRERAEGMGV